MSSPATIALVDDEPGLLRALSRLLKRRGFQVLTYDTPKEFLRDLPGLDVDCLVLDVSMPELNGLEVQKRLQHAGQCLPIIFLTGQGDIPTSVRAIKAGAVNFLTKPVEEKDLLAAFAAALEQGERERVRNAGLADLRARAELLTLRELEILRHVVSGRLNKQIAGTLGITEQTVKVHRMRITEKMKLFSVAELVQAANRLGITPPMENRED